MQGVVLDDQRESYLRVRELLVLLVNTTLGLFKPRGLTRYGRRKQQERRTATAKSTQTLRLKRLITRRPAKASA